MFISLFLLAFGVTVIYLNSVFDKENRLERKIYERGIVSEAIAEQERQKKLDELYGRD